MSAAPIQVFATFIATSAGVGLVPLAPGTFGSLVGVALFWWVSSLGLLFYLLFLFAFSLLGIWASGLAEVFFEKSDDGRIVIDEVVGQLVVLTPLIPLRGAELPLLGSLDAFFLLTVTGFVAFRVFDIWKPGVVGWTEKNLSGGVGVMADDLVAGALGALVVALPAGLLLYSVAARGAAT